MSSLEAITGKNYLSYSALQSYLDCGERFRLERVLNAPQEQSWWLIGGKAVHTATELLDAHGWADSEVERAWQYGWSAALDELGDVDRSTIRAGGRVSKQWPNKEDDSWWGVHGPQMVQAWVDWRNARYAEGWMLLEIVGGQLAVEVPIQIEFPDVLVKGFIDRVFITDAGEVIVIDLKTGTHTPASSLQLGVYGLGVQRNLQVTPTLGAYWMARTGQTSPQRSLLHYTHELVGRWFAHAKAGIEQQLFIPHVTSLCNTCSVAQYCAAMGGTAVVPTASAL